MQIWRTDGTTKNTAQFGTHSDVAELTPLGGYPSRGLDGVGSLTSVALIALGLGHWRHKRIVQRS